MLIGEISKKTELSKDTNKGQLRFGNMDDKIELNLKEETKFPELKQNQVALNLAKTKTGHILKLNKDLYLGEGEIYHVFDSIKEAKDFAKKIISENSELEAWIMVEKNKAIFYINSFEEKEFN